MNLAELIEAPLTKPQLARCLGIGPRQVDNLLVAGCPSRREAGRVVFEWPAVREWYIDQKIKAAKGRAPDADAARDRLDLAKARLAEIELARAEKTMVPVTDVTRLWGDQVAAVAGKLSSAPSKYAQRCLGLTSVGQAMKVLDQAMQEALAELTAAPEVSDD